MHSRTDIKDICRVYVSLTWPEIVSGGSGISLNHTPQPRLSSLMLKAIIVPSTLSARGLGSSPDTAKAGLCDSEKILSVSVSRIESKLLTRASKTLNTSRSPCRELSFLLTLLLPFWPLTIHKMCRGLCIAVPTAWLSITTPSSP